MVKGTRLWRREKAAVAGELVAHFLDGMEEGRTAEDLIETFGDAKSRGEVDPAGKATESTGVVEGGTAGSCRE